ncbi:MAG: DUF2279 domain-containing protein [Bacteroidetes bacterium]|nr:MAG: DUF2279 domain-containing protein [Bacteroidota bacterium]
MLPKLPYWHKLVILPLLFLSIQLCAQDSTNTKFRKQTVIIGNSIAYTGTMVGLYQLWYKDHDLIPFHFFNDNQEWQQMDKVGHSFSCYYEGVAGIEMMKWAGYSKKQYSLIGGSYGFLIQTSVEVFDGFSSGWGASMGDVAANALGASLAIGQSLAWDEQRIWMKYSYNPSPYSAIRPNALGSNFPERLLKDYNAQTYWLSANIHSFAPESKIPKWLNLAVGYGADGMLGGHSNRYTSEGYTYDYTNIKRHRQFYLAPDIDLSRIKTKKKAVRTLLIMANAIKFPMPTLEYHTDKGLRGHWFKL